LLKVFNNKPGHRLTQIQYKEYKMRKTNVLSVIVPLVMLCSLPLFAKKLAVLAELQKPESMIVNGDLLLIGDSAPMAHLYNLKDFSYRQLSKRGDGPGEISANPRISITKDSLFLYNLGRCIFFSREGKLEHQFRIKRMGTRYLYPFGKNYLMDRFGKTEDGKNYSKLFLVSYSKNTGVKDLKLLYSSVYTVPNRTDGKQPLRMIPTYFATDVFKNRLFVHDNTKGIYCEIFDLEGNPVGKINLPYKKKKVPDNYTDKMIRLIKSKKAWDWFQSTHYFDVPKYYPPFYRFAVDDNKAYFLTFNEKEGKRELLTTDWEGNLLKRSYVPWVGETPHTYFDIQKNKFYYIQENEDTEQWELHVEDIT